MKKSYPGIVMFLFLLTPIFSQAQDKGDVRGKVKNKAGEALTGVNINLDHGKKLVHTDEKGTFHIKDITVGKHQVRVSLIGYESQTKAIEIKSGSTAAFNFVLEEANYQLGEVMIQRKSNITEINEQAYNVHAIDTRQLYNSAQDMAGVLGKIPGVRMKRDGGLGSE